MTEHNQVAGMHGPAADAGDALESPQKPIQRQNHSVSDAYREVLVVTFTPELAHFLAQLLMGI